MKCGESIFPKGKKWGDTLQEEEGPQSIKWTLMKIMTLGVRLRVMVEFGSIPGVFLPLCVVEERHCFSMDDLLSSDLTSRRQVKAMLSSTRNSSYGLFCK